MMQKPEADAAGQPGWVNGKQTYKSWISNLSSEIWV